MITIYVNIYYFNFWYNIYEKIFNCYYVLFLFVSCESKEKVNCSRSSQSESSEIKHLNAGDVFKYESDKEAYEFKALESNYLELYGKTS